MDRIIGRLFAIFVALGALAGPPTTGQAHPHILPVVRANVTFEDGRASSIQQTWVYDAAYSAFVTRSLDANGDGIISPDELAGFAKTQLDALAEHNYFTTVSTAAGPVEFGPARLDQVERLEDGRLSLTFTLGFKSKVAPKKPIVVEIFDPNFFAYFTMADDGVRLIGSHDGCSSNITGPQPIDLRNTRSIPGLFWEALNNGSKAAGQAFINRITVTCP